MKRKLMGMVALCFAATFLNAEQSPVAISLLPSVQWPRADADITGLRLNVLAGAHHNVYGVDVATIGNVVSNCTAGIQLAGFGNYSDTVYGFQIGGVYNVADEKLSGFQIGVFNYAEKANGLQVGVLNYIEDATCSFLPLLNMQF